MSIESTPADQALVADEPGPAEAGSVQHNGQSRLMLNLERFALPGLFAVVLIFFSAWSTTGHLFGTEANFQEVASNYVYIGILTLAVAYPSGVRRVRLLGRSERRIHPDCGGDGDGAIPRPASLRRAAGHCIRRTGRAQQRQRSSPAGGELTDCDARHLGHPPWHCRVVHQRPIDKSRDLPVVAQLRIAGTGAGSPRWSTSWSSWLSWCTTCWSTRRMGAISPASDRTRGLPGWSVSVSIV